MCIRDRYKVDVAEQRIHDIDPNIKVTTHRCFFGPETQDDFDFTQYDLSLIHILQERWKGAIIALYHREMRRWESKRQLKEKGTA